MWRWSNVTHQKPKLIVVFSTCVEVILVLTALRKTFLGILHVCGGDPNIIKLANYWLFYSPRVWRWSPSQNIVKQLHPVFSTYVEVILAFWFRVRGTKSILHVCGGDPLLISRAKENDEYSPRVWRWSLFISGNNVSIVVFSTCVEVILCFSVDIG